MTKINEYEGYPTISILSNQDTIGYQMNHISVLKLLKRIEELEEKIDKMNLLEERIKILENNQRTYSEILINENPQNKNQDIVVTKANVSVGDIVTMGMNKDRPIEWKILEVDDDGSCLLFSNKVLFDEAFNPCYDAVSWETCKLRDYLNNIFFMKAFSEDEKSKIMEINHEDEVEEFVDKLFLLSEKEIQSYFEKDEERRATYEDGRESGYWLRTMGFSKNRAMGVYDDGSLDYFGSNVYNTRIGVRPALWAKLKEKD